jgi:uncharacterized protein YjfI (DUF2170 family)
MEGAELVKEVSLSMPGSTIEEILEKTNEILNKRIFDRLPRDAQTVFHLFEGGVLGVPEENAYKILGMITKDSTFPESLRIETQKFIDSQLFNSISKFIIVTPPPVGCFCFRGRSSSSKK